MIESPSVDGWIARLEVERDKPANRHGVAMVDAIIRHWRCESKGDWEAVMGTLADDAVYRVTGYGVRGVRTSDKREQRRIYEDDERASPGHLMGLEMEHHRFIVGIDSVALDGRVHQWVGSEGLGGRGLERPGDTAVADEFLVSWRMAIFMRFRDGAIADKNLYLGAPSIERHRERT